MRSDEKKCGGVGWGGGTLKHKSFIKGPKNYQTFEKMFETVLSARALEV